MRVANCIHLCEMLGDSGGLDDDADVISAGRLFILPSSHVGGDSLYASCSCCLMNVWFMRQQIHEIVAVFKATAHPDLFRSMKCNRKWPETTRWLSNGIAQDGLELSAMVLKMKLRALRSRVLHDIKGKPFSQNLSPDMHDEVFEYVHGEEEIFGNILSPLWVISF